jgi:DNA-binding NarL/FixJ family response regulator
MATLWVHSPNLIMSDALASYVAGFGYHVQLEPEPPPDLALWNLSVMRPPFPLPPPLPTLALLGDVSDEDIVELLRLGYRGYCRPGDPPENLASALKAVLRGGVWADSRLIAEALAPRHLPQLTPKEAQVMSLIRLGLSNKLIARRLDIAENTVKTHVSSILDKYGAKSRRDLMQHAHRHPAPD